MKRAGRRLNIRFNPLKETKIFRLRDIVQKNNGNLSQYISFMIRNLYNNTDSSGIIAGINKSYVKETESEVLGFYISDNVNALITEIAEKTDMSISKVVKKAVERYIEETNLEYVKSEDELSDFVLNNYFGERQLLFSEEKIDLANNNTIIFNTETIEKQKPDNLKKKNTENDSTKINGTSNEIKREYLNTDKSSDPGEDLFNNLLGW